MTTRIFYLIATAALAVLAYGMATAAPCQAGDPGLYAGGMLIAGCQEARP